MNNLYTKYAPKCQALFTCLLTLIVGFGCSTTSSVQLLEKDSLALKKLVTTENFTLSASEIVDRARENGKIRENSNNLPIFSFHRKVTITKPVDVNGTVNEKIKTYKAYTNNRDQTLIKVDGREPTEKEIEEDRKRNLKRQRQYLDRNNKKNSDRIISNNIEIYKEKFIPRLIGYESINNRPAYIVQLVPNAKHRLKNNTSDRIMNQMQIKIWVYQEEFQVSKMEAKLVEPVNELFKDEVRKIGKTLNIPDEFLMRHPFPGPGLAIRILGKITHERLKILRKADDIFISLLHEYEYYNKIWQAFCVLLPLKTVGVMGDKRTYENVICIRMVTSIDGMTADWYDLPEKILKLCSNRIVNEVKGVNRVVLDITSKPPGTIEWE